MNIKAARKAAKLTQQNVADYLNIQQTSYARYENGTREPDIDTLHRLSKLFNVSIDYLTRGDQEQIPPNPIKKPGQKKYISIPVLGSIPAGIPFEAIEDILDWEDIPVENTLPGKKYFGLKIKGDSMEPEYKSGDTIIIQQQDHCNNGDDCAVMVNGCDATFKRVRLHEDGITLQPLNPKYDPNFYSAKAVQELPVRILGVAKEIRRSIRK